MTERPPTATAAVAPPATASFFKKLRRSPASTRDLRLISNLQSCAARRRSGNSGPARPGRLIHHLKVMLVRFDELLAELSHSPVEARRTRGLHVPEQARHPRSDVALEEPGLSLQGIRLPLADQERHDFAQCSRMILGFADVLPTLEAESLHIVAQHGKGLLHEESGEIPGGIGDQLTPADADEKGLVLVCDLRGVRTLRGLSEQVPGDAK